MTCEEIQQLMLEAEAQEMAHEEVRKHLLVCADCRVAWREYEEVMASLREMESMSPPPGFTERIVTRVAMQRAFRRQMVLAALVVVGVGTMAWLFSEQAYGWLSATLSASTWTATWLPHWYIAKDWFSSFDFETTISTVRWQWFGLPVWQIGLLLGVLGLGWVVAEALDYLPRKTRR